MKLPKFLSKKKSAAPIEKDPSQIAAEQLSEATQWHMVWVRFKRHRLAMVSAGILSLYVLVVVFADFIAPYGATARDNNYLKGPPEIVKIWDGGPARPHIDSQITTRGGVEDGFAFKVKGLDSNQQIRWFVHGKKWTFLGLFDSDFHLFGVGDEQIPVVKTKAPSSSNGIGSIGGGDAGGSSSSDTTSDDPFASIERGEDGRFQIGGTTTTAAAVATTTTVPDTASDTVASEPEVIETIAAPGFVHLLGTDGLGRDQFSRIMVATRTSMTIGLAGLFTAFFLGLIFGGISGFAGGWIDYAIQRLIEIVRSIPTIPLVMGLAAAFPQDWTNQKIFFFTAIILGLVGWTTLARRIRSMLLTLQDEDFVVAARLAGAGPVRIVTRHMLPTFFSYIVVTLAIEFPYMILAESVLSFIGLGLRPPTVSWGVLLQDAQKVEVLEQTPWLLAPAGFIVVAILAFNFLGDGLRDAADPYQESS